MTETYPGSAAATPVILLIGTFDTKAVELAAVRTAIERLGASVITLDASVGGGPIQGQPDVPATEVAAAGGLSLAELGALSRGDAVSAMQAGVTSVTLDLFERGRVHGVLCVAGAGAHLVGPAFQGLPLGVPKMIVTPLASGARVFEPFVGIRDVAILHSVADVAGVNAVTEKIYTKAAGYIVGAARAMLEFGKGPSNGKPTIAASMNGNTTLALSRARELLSEYELVAFHANGAGGKAMESLIADGAFTAVLDYTTTELGGHEVGGLMDPGPHRMESAGEAGLPQVLVPGCVDFITCGRPADAEREFPGRVYYPHNPELTLVRLTTEEMRSLGTLFARKANDAKGPTAVCAPTKGFSVADCEGGVFWDPVADEAFLAALRGELSANVQLQLVDAHINEPDFVDVVVDALREMIARRTTAQAREGSVANVVR
jgi:uncharacterized protein (UPF0261 family)